VVTWTEKLRTGVAEIDEQHQLLFRRAAVVREAVAEGRATEEVKASLTFLADYAAVHFETEARYMLAAAFPMSPAHLAEHVVLARRLEGAAQAYVDGGESPALAEEVAELFETWLQDHIEGHDRVLATWLQRVGRTQRS
jgi:hemerythrin